jgi:hypothetical protein
LSDDLLLKPTVTLAAARGFIVLENYSSLKRYWDLLSGLAAHGYTIEIPRRQPPEQCRRSIKGIGYLAAGGLCDFIALRQALDDDSNDLTAFQANATASEALTQLLEGETTALSALLSQHYRLEYRFGLGLSQERQLLAKVEGQFVPLAQAFFAADLPLKPRRLGKSEYRVMLERAAGVWTTLKP